MNIKKYLLPMAVASGSLAAMAQSEITNNPSNHTYFGLRASLDIACPGDIHVDGVDGIKISAYKPGAGFSIGGICNIPVVANLYFEPGLSFYYNTYGMKELFVEDDDAEISVSGSVRKCGVRVPLQFGYRFDFAPDISLAVFTGPELEAGFSAKEHFTAKAGHLKESDSESLYQEGGLQRFDCLWKIGFGFNLSHNYYIGVSGSFGLCNMMRESSFTFHESLVQLTLGYNF